MTRTEYQRQYYERNREAKKASSRSYYAAHKVQFKAYGQSPKRKVVRRKYELKKRYGLTVEQFDTMLAAQGGKCAVCRSPEPGGKGTWHVDHDHSTERVRGILCHGCNTGSKLTDDPALLRAKANYLEKE